MRLLLDQNLSLRLCYRLRDIWPDVAHVGAMGLATANDADIWAYARQNGFTIVSKDGDFRSRSSLFGAPPKVIWLVLGNCSTDEVERRLRVHQEEIDTFVAEPGTTLLVIGSGQDGAAL